jgi:flagellar hook-associated protein 3 FlgL
MFSPSTGRISNSTISRNYNRQLLGSQRLSNELAYRISAESRRFTSMAENTSGGVRAMELRRNIERLHSHRDNAQSALSLVEAAEGQLSNAFRLVDTVRTEIVRAIDDPSAGDEATRPEVLAGQLRHARDSMLSIMNGRFGDRFLFGGTIIDRAPFTYDPDNPDIRARLTFRGEEVMTTLNEQSVDFDDAKHEFVKRPTYLDVGLGLAFDEYGNVDPNTAYMNSFDGLQIFGEGDMNIIFLIDRMIEELERHPGSFNHDAMGALLDRFTEASHQISLQVVRIGSDANQLQFMIDRFNKEEINLEDRRTQIEREDPEKLIMDWKMAESAYNAALQMGQRVLMPSLWDYMR